MFWIAIVRACMAIGLGLALMVQEDKTRPLLLNFMGVFWLVSGLIVLRTIALGRQQRRFGVPAGVLGVGTGLAVLFRSALDAGSDRLVIVLLGLVILLTGVIHALGGFEDYVDQRQRLRPALALGVAEVVLGAMFVASPLTEARAIYWAASIWALCAGAVLIGDALHMRTRSTVGSKDRGPV